MRLVIALAAILSACGNDNGGNVLTDTGRIGDGGIPGCLVEANFGSIHDGLLASTRCAISGCHASTNPGGNLDMQAGKDMVHAALVGAATDNALAVGTFPNRVAMSDAANSYLFVKISEVDPVGGGSGRMPPGLPLDPCVIQAIQEWINNGAAND